MNSINPWNLSQPSIRPLPALAQKFMEVAGGYFAAGDFKACHNSLKWALQKAPDHADVIAAYAATALQLGDFAEARRQFEKSVVIEPRACIFAQLALACLALQDIPAFETALGKALELDRDCPEALRVLGDLNAQNGQFQAAADAYRHALQRSPKDLPLHLLLAAALYATEEHVGAKKAYSSALQIDFENPVARKYLQLIDQHQGRPPRKEFKDLRQEVDTWLKEKTARPTTAVQPAAPPTPSDVFAETRKELSAAFEQQNGAYYLAPTDLSGDASPPKRWLVVGSCLAQTWVEGFTAKCPGDFVFTNNFAELPDDPPVPAAEYDFQIVQIAVRSIMSDQALWEIPYDDEPAHVALFQATCARLEQQLAAKMVWNRKHGLLTFVTNFMVPQQNPMGRLLPRYDYRNPVYFFEKLNEALQAQVAAYTNAHVLDLDQISAAFGRKYIQEDSTFWLSHAAYIPGTEIDRDRIQPTPLIREYYNNHTLMAFEAVWAEATAMFRTLRQLNPVKLVVVDLDDTLWPGIIGERTEIVSLEILEGSKGSWPMGMIEALGFLKKRGVLLAIISKNDEARIREFWPKIFGPLLPLDYFAAVKINWQPKAENLREILEQTNLLSRNVVFVDDNPVERAAMRAAFPELRMTSGLHFYWKRTLLWSAETQTARITSESGRRTEMVRSQIARESERKALSREEFLNTLNLTIELAIIQSLEDPRFARAFELINKTNQFNTTGKRWRPEECREAFASGGVFHTVSATDKFCDYGLVGVAIRTGAKLEQFVMSCRVVGLGVEIAVLSEVVGAARAEDHTAFQAVLIKTDANFLCQNLFRSCGFEENAGAWELNDLENLPPPAHVKFTDRSQPSAERRPVVHAPRA